MNIFMLDRDLESCVKYHTNSHTIKMILEYSQILSTAHRVLDGKLIGKKWLHFDTETDALLYKATHINHPSTIWARQSKQNYKHLFKLLFLLSHEYTHRYGKIHASTRLFDILEHSPINIEDSKLTEIPQCMPDHCKLPDTVDAYRNYYMLEKRHIAAWKNREVPYWYK
uniref:Uncharacterized protein n=1 Tax=viral metagenome TaxID=1070528 RepID=A0A6C0JWP1_9ZZZZ